MNKNFRIFVEKNLGIPVLIASVISIFLGISINSLGLTLFIHLRVFLIYFIASILVLWGMLLKLINMYNEKESLSELSLIRFNNSSGSLTCFLKPCDFLSNNVLLTIYLLDKNEEIYLATAKVIEIQSNKYMHAKILNIVKNTKILNNIEKNNIDFLKKLIVKPLVTDVLLTDILSNEGSNLNE